jgi:hypothetical protein
LLSRSYDERLVGFTDWYHEPELKVQLFWFGLSSKAADYVAVLYHYIIEPSIAK